MTSQYENVPQRIGNAERDAAVERLRVNLDEGRLDQATYETRVATALAATTQDDLEPLFQDLPPVVSSNPTYELYPHQSVAMPMPSAYYSEPSSEDAVSGEVRTGRGPWGGAPTWIMPLVMVIVIVGFITLMSRGSFWPIWIFFVFPAIFGRLGRNNRIKNGRNGQRPF